MFATVLNPVIIGTCAGVAVTVSVRLAQVLLVLLLFGNFLRRGFIKYYKQSIDKCKPPAAFDISIEEESTVQQQLFEVTVPKERVECFSDGVFAIVATLIILDICEDNVPTKKEVADAGHSVSRALEPDAAVFLAYAGTFVSIGLLWYVHHSLLHHIKVFNMMMSVFNNLCLLSIGITPLTFKISSTYELPIHKNNRNENIAIQLNCALMFLAGIFQCMLWVTALWSQQRSVLAPGRYGTAEHNYMTAKLCVFPSISLLVYLLSLGPDINFTLGAFNGMQIGCLGLFIILQIVYSFYRRKNGGENNPGIEVEPVILHDVYA